MNRKMVPMESLIQEISMGPFGSNLKVECFVDYGVPVLNGSNIDTVKLTEDSFRYVTEEKAKSLKKANTKRGDIVITHRGTLGQIAYIPQNSIYDNYIISQSQFRVTLKTDLVDPVFFVYYFHTNEGQNRLLSFKSHVGVPALAQATTNFRLLDFPYIPLPTQKTIAKVLSDLDAKIEVNNQINEKLEAMAKLIYDYWFVQFDFPDQNGRPYKSSGGKMVYNEELKREIPEGWDVGNILKFVNLVGGGTPSKKIKSYWGDEIYFYTPSDFNEDVFCVNTQDKITKEGLNNSSTRLLPKGTIIISARGTVGNITLLGKEMAMNQSCYAFKSKGNKCFIYNYYAAKSLVKYLKAKSGGSVFNSIVSNDIRLTLMPQPKNELVIEYHEQMKGLFKLILINQIQNQKLASLRDWLLPMLMNGQVSVGQVADFVEAGMSLAAEEEVEYGDK